MPHDGKPESRALIVDEFAEGKVARLNAVGPFVNRQNARVAQVLRSARFFNIPDASKHLNAR